jgi:ABC-2 type transport system permease protein
MSGSIASALKDVRAVLVEVRWQLVRFRRNVLGWAVALAAVAGIYIPFYPAMGGSELQAIVDTLPPELISAMGYDRIGTPEGYLTSTIFGLLGPALLVVFGIGLGARTIAGEEEAGGLELAASAPVRRDVLLAGRVIAMHTQIAFLALVIFVVTTLLSRAFAMGVASSGIAAASIGLNLMVIAFATVTLAAGAVSGRRAVAVAVGAGVAFAAFIADALSGVVERGDLLTRLSPFSWYLAGDPVTNGIDIVGFALLGAVTFVAWGAAYVAFRRRDLGV